MLTGERWLSLGNGITRGFNFFLCTECSGLSIDDFWNFKDILSDHSFAGLGIYWGCICLVKLPGEMESTLKGNWWVLCCPLGWGRTEQGVWSFLESKVWTPGGGRGWGGGVAPCYGKKEVAA